VVSELFEILTGSFRSGGANHFGNRLTVSFRRKDLICIYLDLISLIVFALLYWIY